MTDAAVTSVNRRLDLDLALLESEPLTVTYGGRDYVLPATIPARVILKHAGSIGESGLPLERLMEFMEDLVGKRNMDQMMEDGLPYKALEELLTWLLREYGITTPGSDSEAKADPNPLG